MEHVSASAGSTVLVETAPVIDLALPPRRPRLGAPRDRARAVTPPSRRWADRRGLPCWFFGAPIRSGLERPAIRPVFAPRRFGAYQNAPQFARFHDAPQFGAHRKTPALRARLTRGARQATPCACGRGARSATLRCLPLTTRLASTSRRGLGSSSSRR